jgi:hypothetical protein
MTIVIGLVFAVVSIIITRLIGAWMFRINDVIANQEAILAELRRARYQKEAE